METKIYKTAKEFFKYLNNHEADIWIRGSKAYNVNGELIAEYNGLRLGEVGFTCTTAHPKRKSSM